MTGWNPEQGGHLPYGPPPSEPPPPVLGSQPPRRSTGRTVIVVLAVFAVVVAAVAVAVIALRVGSESDERPGGDPPPVVPTQSGPAVTPTASAEPEPAATEASEPAEDPPQYSYDELPDHPLLAEGIGLPNLECSVATPVGTRSELEAHATDVIECLDRMWEPALRAAGVAHRTPELFVPVSMSALTSPCGDWGEDYLAFYCTTDAGIYLPLDTIGMPPNAMPHYYAWIVAHEYGHHVQYLSGIGQASDEEERARRTFSPGAREVLRRLETQAECFAGIFLGSSDSSGNLDMASHYNDFMEWTTASGPSETHGSGEVQTAWWSAGYLSNRTASCNTYGAPAEDLAAE